MKYNFEQYSTNSPEFLKYAVQFKRHIRKNLPEGAKIEAFNTGHFYLSGFFSISGHLWYFSWHNGDNEIMYRTAKHLKDYTGGVNRYTDLENPKFEYLNITIKQ